MERVVLVTGGSGGIGGAIATAFARTGNCVVVGCNTHQEEARRLCANLAAQGLQATAVAGDVTNAQQVDALFTKAEELYGKVDVLINNAGIAAQSLFCDVHEEEWDKMMNVHAKGTFLCSRRALPAMIQKKAGCIINVSSVWGQVGASCEVAYSAAKAAVIGLTKALAKEVAPSHIRVNCVAPGVINTAMMDGFGEKEKRQIEQGIPLGRMGTPEEVAATVFFLASEGAAYYTGQVLAPNGGMMM